MDNRANFLIELAELLDKHSAVVCSSLDASEVFFIFNEWNYHDGDKPKRQELWTGRNHSTGYEMRVTAQRFEVEESS
jgi:hypothetical protein